MEKLNILKRLSDYENINYKLANTILNIQNCDIDEICALLDQNKFNNLDKTGFNSECFEKYKKEEDIYLKFLDCDTMEDSILQCKNCFSRKIYTVSKQVRRADEPETVFAKCLKCNKNWIV